MTETTDVFAFEQVQFTYSEIECALVVLTHLTPTAPITAAKSVPASQQIDQSRKLVTEEMNPCHLAE